jgi:hypothetical protein
MIAKVEYKTADEYARQLIREELDAIDSYSKILLSITPDNMKFLSDKEKSLHTILTHNMNEEKEHIALLIEWFQAYDPEFLKAFKHKVN